MMCATSESSPTSTLGTRMRFVRERLGFSNKSEFARLIGVRPETLLRYEKDEFEPSVTALIRFVSATSVSLDWVVLEKGPVPFQEVAGAA